MSYNMYIKMEWKQKILSTLTYLKSKRHFSLWVAGSVFLLIYLPYCIILNNANRRQIESMLEDLETLKRWKSSQSSEPALANDKNKPVVFTARHRKRREVNNIKNSGHGSESMTNGGAVFIRWGRMTCPDNYTEVVYSGIAGGSWHDHHGSATNIQCLPDKPDWGRFTDGAGNAFMYGVEYRDAMTNVIDMSNIQTSLASHNVPCAVCRSITRTSALMIPAKNVCFEGWHLEYHGYLMAGHHGSKSGTQYICVDEAPEVDPAGYRDEGGALLFRVTGQCGSLPCPRYVQNREFTCVVCTK